MKFNIKTINRNNSLSILNCVGLSTKAFILVLFAFNVKTQTYNIPANSGTSNSYVGSLTGDLNLNSTAGNLFLNTTGTFTTPNMRINM